MSLDAPKAQALLEAAKSGDLKRLQELSHDGADLNCCNEEGKTVAMLAASAGHDSILRWLTMKRGPSLFNLAAADGGTPAMSAAVHGNAAALETLVDVSNLNSQDEDGWTALMFAACAGHPGECMRLRREGRGGGLTKTKAVTQLLLSAGADSKLRNKDGDDALALAKARGFTAVVDVFEKPTLSFKVVGGPGDEE